MNLQKGNIILIVVLAMFSIALLGCAGNLPEAKRADILEMNWGKSIESAKNNQILNPDAGKNIDPVVGLDGEIAEHGVNKYKKSFEKDVPVKTTTSFEITEQD
jgi:hypothetical protein